MSKSLDLSSLTRSERMVLTAGIALAINGFIPWWYRIQTANGTFTYNGGLTGYGVTAVAAGMLATIMVLARTNIWPRPAPRADGTIYAGFGLVSVSALAIQISRTDVNWIGIYVALAFAILLMIEGFVRRRERRAGWQ